MDITEQIRANHRDHSALAEEFLNYVLAEPERTKQLNWGNEDLPAWVLDQYPAPLQRFPTFIGPRKLEEVKLATVGLWQFVRSLPKKFFRNDPKKFSDFFGVNNELLALLLLEPPNGLLDSFTRCDFVDSLDGFKCLEFNLGTNIGGWEIRFWEEKFHNNPVLSSFLEGRKLDLFYRDPLWCLYQQVVETVLETGRSSDTPLNFAIILDPGMRHLDRISKTFNQTYSAVLSEIDLALRGEILLCAYPDGVEIKGPYAYVDNKKVSAIIEYSTQATTPQEVYRCFKSGEVLLYGGPLKDVMATKRILVLLSEAEDSKDLSSEEREMIRRFIPWSRDLKAGKTKFRGQHISLIELLIARREDFVIKPNVGSSGEGIAVGRFTPQEKWEQVIRRGAESPGVWMVQEYVASRSYLYQLADGRFVPHDMIWGTFSFGDSFGGGFLRIMPQGVGSGVINSATGASEGIIFEVSSHDSLDSK